MWYGIIKRKGRNCGERKRNNRKKRSRITNIGCWNETKKRCKIRVETEMHIFHFSKMRTVVTVPCFHEILRNFAKHHRNNFRTTPTILSKESLGTLKMLENLGFLFSAILVRTAFGGLGQEM